VVVSDEPGILARGPWDPALVQTSWRSDAYEPPPEATAAADDAIAELDRRGSPTHDGLSARLAGYRERDGRLELELQPARWALRLAGFSTDSM
jgi:8-oxo-dGTP diphosphatase